MRITSSHRAVSDLVGAERRADFVVQDFRRGAGQRSEAGVFQRSEELADGHADRRGALMHFERRERVDVNARRSLAHGRQISRYVWPVKLGSMPPCMQTSVAPRSQASLARRAISSSVSVYGLPRRFSLSLPFENAQNWHLNVQTLV